ncbi:MAG: DNA repair protein RecN [Syntrophomonadaceae bacterium]|nr:DNA repair protein RecN [Syntrophomonadaceae bacterium]
MLQEIYINNFVLIDELRLELQPGLNVLTGETGAGKSIIIDALGLLIGDRISSDYIKNKEQKALVEAVFDVSNNKEARHFLEKNGLLEEDGLLIVSREISPGSRNLARINGRSVNISLLKNLAVNILDMHVQDEQLSILRPDMYLGYVDCFAVGSEELLIQVQNCFKEIRRLKKELEELQIEEMNNAEKLDFLSYQIEEIEKAGLLKGEEEELLGLAHRIRNARKLLEGSQGVLDLLYNGQGHNAYDLIAMSIALCSELRGDPFFEDLHGKLKEVYYFLQDQSSQIASYRDSLDFDPGRQEEIEERLFLINKLKNKYGGSIEATLDHLEQAREQKAVLDNRQVHQESLQKELDSWQQQYYALAARLSAKRRQGAETLQEMVKNELIELNLPHIRFQVSLQELEEPAYAGLDKAEFLFSANPGEELRPLSRTASGGERSRFVLALKKALAQVYQVPTLIFDEIDIGVGGSSLTSMALKLSQLAASHQLILVTHSPQVASYARQHCLIEKKIINGKTSTLVKTLNGEEKIAEIARMLGGDNYSQLTLEHAREMYTQAQSSI